MALSKYEAFVHCAELGSLTLTAEEMHCTQSAVSHMIGSLEEELGFTVMRRSRAGVILTEDGKKILPAVRSLLAAYESFKETVGSIHGLEAGTVRIGAFTSVAVHWLPKIIGSFQKEHPNIEFILNNGDYYDVEQWLKDGTIDIGFISYPFESEMCTSKPLMEDRILAVVPAQSNLSNLENCPLSIFANAPVISLPESSAHDLRRVFSESSLVPNIKFTTKDDYAIIAMVEQGLGISVMPELLLTGMCYDIEILELENKPSRTIGLSVLNSSLSSPATAAFEKFIVNWISENVPNNLVK